MASTLPSKPSTPGDTTAVPTARAAILKEKLLRDGAPPSKPSPPAPAAPRFPPLRLPSLGSNTKFVPSESEILEMMIARESEKGTKSKSVTAPESRRKDEAKQKTTGQPQHIQGRASPAVAENTSLKAGRPENVLKSATLNPQVNLNESKSPAHETVQNKSPTIATTSNLTVRSAPQSRIDGTVSAGQALEKSSDSSSQEAQLKLDVTQSLENVNERGIIEARSIPVEAKASATLRANGGQAIDPNDADLQDWLVITQFYDVEYRNKILKGAKRRRRLAALEEEMKRLMAEMAAEEADEGAPFNLATPETGALLHSSTPLTTPASPPAVASAALDPFENAMANETPAASAQASQVPQKNITVPRLGDGVKRERSSDNNEQRVAKNPRLNDDPQPRHAPRDKSLSPRRRHSPSPDPHSSWRRGRSPPRRSSHDQRSPIFSRYDERRSNCERHKRDDFHNSDRSQLNSSIRPSVQESSSYIRGWSPY
jgi:hypothetical protein